MRSRRMPRRRLLVVTTRNTGSDQATRLVASSSRTSVSAPSALMERLVACLIDRLQQILKHRFMAGEDFDARHHTGQDRQLPPTVFETGRIGLDQHDVVGFAGIWIDDAVGGNVLNLALQSTKDREVVSGEFDIGRLTRKDESHVLRLQARLDQPLFLHRPNVEELLAGVYE